MKRLIPLILLLSACGAKGDLHPKPNAQPKQERNAQEAPNYQKLTTPDTRAHPKRSGEVIERSQEREPDKFNPPPSS